MNRTTSLLLVILAVSGCARKLDRSPGNRAQRPGAAVSQARPDAASPSPNAKESAVTSFSSDSGRDVLQPANADCPQVHEHQRWAPLETTIAPIRKVDCADDATCISIHPSSTKLTGCATRGAGCRPTVILPRATSVDSKRAIVIQMLLDKAIEDNRPADDDCWLSFLDYTIHSDAHGILDVSFRISGVGAYPSTLTKHISIAATTGTRLTPDMAFREESLAELAKSVDKKLQAALSTAPTVEPDHYRYDEPATFQIADLADFIVTPKGIVFLYDFGLPHVTRVASPDSEYLMTPHELRPFIKPNGPLLWIVRTRP